MVVLRVTSNHLHISNVDNESEMAMDCYSRSLTRHISWRKERLVKAGKDSGCQVWKKNGFTVRITRLFLFPSTWKPCIRVPNPPATSPTHAMILLRNILQMFVVGLEYILTRFRAMLNCPKIIGTGSWSCSGGSLPPTRKTAAADARSGLKIFGPTGVALKHARTCSIFRKRLRMSYMGHELRVWFFHRYINPALM